MKKLLACFYLLFILWLAKAEYYKFIPIDVTQPDKTVLHCYTSGDEYYHWIHDKNGYTIIQSETDGYFYYAIKNGDILEPSKYRVGTINPQLTDISPWLKISQQKYEESKAQQQRYKLKSASGLSTGTLINIVIYIRFKNDTEFTKTRRDFSTMLNATGLTSLKDYYRDVSYGKLSMQSSQYPVCDSAVNISFQDTLDRAYYSPYNAVTNPIGYTDDSGIREQSLVERAINAVKSQIPSSLVVDANSDSYVDNVTIVVRGNADGWGKLLWPHQWWLGRNARINEKQVGTYIFITENMYDVSTMCHEMFHVIGAPDLYHYTDNGIDPIGPWSGGITHVTAFMKWKYSNNNWISSIPEITKTGDYYLKPLTSSTRNCYKIKSPYSSTEYFTLEFRKKQGLYESYIPASGLLISRINSLANGNGNGPPDEVYVCRPQGSAYSSGNVNEATFDKSSGRENFNGSSNPRPFLSDGSNAGISVSDITMQGDSVLFHVDITNNYVNKNLWVVKTDSYENSSANDPGSNAIDNSSSTIWHTPWSSTQVPYPHWITVDFRAFLNIKGIKYLPRQDSETGRIREYELYASNDETNWTLIASDTFSNKKEAQIVSFSERYCRFVKLVAKKEVNGKAFAAIAELDVVTNTPVLPKTKWKLLNVSSTESSNEPKLAFDNKGPTFWHSRWTAPIAQYPHEFAIDMGEICCIEGASYLPRQDGNNNGTIAKYEFYSSLDRTSWKLLSNGQWPANSGEKQISFPKTVCRYFKLKALSEINSKDFASIAEINVFGTISNDITPPAKPTNFRLASRNKNTYKLAWGAVTPDNSILYYTVFSADSIIGKVYNPLILINNIDTTKNHSFSVSATDGSGNLSDTAQLYVAPIINTHVNLSNYKPLVYSSEGKIYISQLEGENSIIKVYDPLGRILATKRCNNTELVFAISDYSGIAIISIEGMHGKTYLTKILIRQ